MFKHLSPRLRLFTLPLFRWLITALIIILFIVSWVLVQNTFNMKETRISIPTAHGQLTGILALPKHHSDKVGLVVFVHGDGPINASYDGGYRPLWEKLAMAGYASLSLDKPGIGGSSGNWLDQTMEDRAQDVLTALEWARKEASIDQDRIGLWGASQAGWVIPYVVKQDAGIAFSILVSPAINWITQGRYNTRQEMLQEEYTREEITARQLYNDQVLQLIRNKATYDEYLHMANKEQLISKERWTFIVNNVESDATDGLASFHSPVHLVLGGRDINVDVQETERVYRQMIPQSLLSVTKLPDADHSMLPSSLVHSTFKTYATALFSPRKLMDAHYLDDIVQFLNSIRDKS
ncbi:S9 family peptidase [Paenibacillus sp. E222]|uniref:alpha/beta hydrolase family protein n=1 Tax=Paenibacillus sp. E222 TaxID=2748863 RepID=UPI00211BDC95|nr:alpha/beta fold hydrolase [Paenibacillus sp. E222]